jgi:hypothetical protein
MVADSHDIDVEPDLDPHQIEWSDENPDADPYQSRVQICIKVKNRIRIRIKL